MLLTAVKSQVNNERTLAVENKIPKFYDTEIERKLENNSLTLSFDTQNERGAYFSTVELETPRLFVCRIVLAWDSTRCFGGIAACAALRRRRRRRRPRRGLASCGATRPANCAANPALPLRPRRYTVMPPRDRGGGVFIAYVDVLIVLFSCFKRVECSC